MRSNKGITLSSLTIYVIGMAIAIGIISTLSTFFYKNLEEVDTSKHGLTAYTGFNTYFTKEINTKENYVVFPTQEEGETSYIVFAKTGNQYTFKNNAIYQNKVKICKNIDHCTFMWNETEKTVTVNIITIDNIEYSNTYKIRNY